MCGQPGIVKDAEGKVLGGLHFRLPATSLPPPPGCRRSPSPTTGDFVLEDSAPHPISKAYFSEVSCLSEASPWGNRQYHTLSRGWAWQGLHMGLSQPLPAPAQVPAPKPLPWETDTPESPPCCHVLVFWLPLDPPESPSCLSRIPPQRESKGLRPPCDLPSVCFSRVNELAERHRSSPSLTCVLYVISDGINTGLHSSQDLQPSTLP